MNEAAPLSRRAKSAAHSGPARVRDGRVIALAPDATARFSRIPARGGRRAHEYSSPSSSGPRRGRAHRAETAERRPIQGPNRMPRHAEVNAAGDAEKRQRPRDDDTEEDETPSVSSHAVFTKPAAGALAATASDLVGSGAYAWAQQKATAAPVARAPEPAASRRHGRPPPRRVPGAVAAGHARPQQFLHTSVYAATSLCRGERRQRRHERGTGAHQLCLAARRARSHCLVRTRSTR